MKNDKNISILLISVMLLSVISLWFFVDTVFTAKKNYTQMSLVEMKDQVIYDQMHQGHYACCLEKPCASCATLDPWHGEGESCTCLEDVMSGKAPCGECIGGILSGRGNKYISQYFADSLVDKVGEEHRETIEKIIDEKYSDQE